MELSNSLQSETLLKNSNSNSNAIKVSNSNTITALNSNSNQVANANNLVGGIFSMKHKKLRTATTAKKSTFTTTSESKTNIQAKSKTNTATNNQLKKAVSQASNKKQVLTSDLSQVNPDLLKQTNLLQAVANAGGQPGDKKKIDLEKMGPIAFHSWVKFFKYDDQVASDKNAKLRFNQSRKFFVNGEFREQLKLYPGEDYQEKGPDGEYKYVSDPQRFYLIAFKHQTVLFSSKMVNLKKN
jgi:hypothetical protein